MAAFGVQERCHGRHDVGDPLCYARCGGSAGVVRGIAARGSRLAPTSWWLAAGKSGVTATSGLLEKPTFSAGATVQGIGTRSRATPRPKPQIAGPTLRTEIGKGNPPGSLQR